MIGHPRAAAAFIAACVFAAASPATAQDSSAPVRSNQPTGEHDVFAGAATMSEFAGAATMSEDDLGKVAGREDLGTQIAQATQRNTVSNNSVVGTSVTGNIAIDGNAFQNLQGLAVISANSGNNVAINSAMNVTINLRPTP